MEKKGTKVEDSIFSFPKRNTVISSLRQQNEIVTGSKNKENILSKLKEDTFIFFNLLLLKSLERLTNRTIPKDDEKRNKISDNDLERKYEPVSLSVRR